MLCVTTYKDDKFSMTLFVTEPSVHNVFSPTFGNVWYTGLQYNILWTSSSLPTADVLLLVSDVFGNVSILLTIASNVANNGLFTWTIPRTLNPGANIYFVTIRPPGQDFVLDGFSRSPPFSISTQPTGRCPSGFVSITGAYPGCSACPQGFYVRNASSASAERIIISDHLL
jgi:hypothetical protein